MSAMRAQPARELAGTAARDGVRLAGPGDSFDGQAHAATAVLERLLRRLETDERPTVARLETVVSTVAAAWGAAGWWIGAVHGDELVTRRLEWRGHPAQAESPRRVTIHSDRGQPVPDSHVPEHGRQLLLELLEGGSAVVPVGDPSGLGDWLPELGLEASVNAGGYDADAVRWMASVLLEDGQGPSRGLARLVTSAAVAAALAGPPR